MRYLVEIINTCLPLDIIYESPRAEPKDKNINSGPVKLIWPKSWKKKAQKKTSHAIFTFTGLPSAVCIY